ncbi:hypothetical protein LguiB_025797 [Lonicera macranthoides]
MALVPSRQFYPTTIFIDSFQSSVAKLHFNGQFFRYGSSICNWKHKPYAINYTPNSDSTPKRNSNFVVKNNSSKLGFSQTNPSTNVSSSSWLVKWNETHNKIWAKPPQAVLNYRNNEDLEECDDRGDSSGSTMDKIVKKLKKFGYVDDLNENKEKVGNRVFEKGSIEDIFYVEEGILPNAQGGFSPESPLGMENGLFGGNEEVRFPWEKPSKKEEERNSVRIKSRTSLAELTIPESELRRLRSLALKTKSKTRIGGAGVTQAVVDLIRDKWKSVEVVRLKIDGAPALNMKRMHEILERKTGGLVIWRSGTSVALYRGVSYEVPSERQNTRTYNKNEIPHKSSSTSREQTNMDYPQLRPLNVVSAPRSESSSVAEERENSEPLPEYEDEVDKLLDGLGPRYTDWPGDRPLPVDADLLPGTVPGFQPPFRILPYGIRSTLGGKEATSLRRLARVLPPHFALGRSRQHQGLAVAMIKLWERSSIAKIVLKRGVQLTTSERMAEDIKKLTGGILLSRNKDFLVFYRGKSFLTPEVAKALLEKERLAKSLQDEEEKARLRASSLFTPSVEITNDFGTAGTLGETLDANARWGKRLDAWDKKKADRKLGRAERALSKVESFLNPSDHAADQGSITDEERFMFRKLGLRMKAFLLLENEAKTVLFSGRRGVFDGTVENMHLHWKYRELVKIIVKAKSFEQVKKVALSLEAESGGVLVSVDKISKGYAIIVYRGNDYKRPSLLRPKNLLTKRKALARSIELQRREEHLANVKDHGDEELYGKLESAYPSEDEDSEEEEGDDSYIEAYDNDHDEEDKSYNSIANLQNLESNFPYDFQESETEKDENHNSLAEFGAS